MASCGETPAWRPSAIASPTPPTPLYDNCGCPATRALYHALREDAQSRPRKRINRPRGKDYKATLVNLAPRDLDTTTTFGKPLRGRASGSLTRSSQDCLRVLDSTPQSPRPAFPTHPFPSRFPL
jgi:hypothetical protein